MLDREDRYDQLSTASFACNGAINVQIYDRKSDTYHRFVAGIAANSGFNNRSAPFQALG